MDFELSSWGDGTIRLVFRDSLHGHDRIFVLSTDGQSLLSSDSDHAEEAFTPVDLVIELRKLVEEYDNALHNSTTL